jgi:hemerythrin-like domain-containing protein
MRSSLNGGKGGRLIQVKQHWHRPFSMLTKNGYAVKQALNIIKSEHRSLATILHAMRYLVERIRTRSAHPNFDAFRAMLYYLDTFSERLHHPKEDEFLFQPLRAHSDEVDAVIGDLEHEHAYGAAAIRSLEQALLRYEAGGEGEFVAFATAVEGYCDFYAQHIHKEETLVLPFAEKLFNHEDWGRIDAAFDANRDPLGGVDEDREFRHLFGRIVSLVPAAMGAGLPE